MSDSYGPGHRPIEAGLVPPEGEGVMGVTLEARQEAFREKMGLTEWRCPSQEISFSVAEPIKHTENWGTCGKKAMGCRIELSESMRVPTTERGRDLLAFGVDPGYPDVKDKPISYKLYAICPDGHEHFVRELLSEEMTDDR